MYVGERQAQQPAVARRVDPEDRHQLAHGERSGGGCTAAGRCPARRRSRCRRTAGPGRRDGQAGRHDVGVAGLRLRRGLTEVEGLDDGGPTSGGAPSGSGRNGPDGSYRRLRTRSARRRSAGRRAAGGNVRAPTGSQYVRPAARRLGRAVPHLSLAPDEPLHVLVPSPCDRRRRRRRCPRGSTPTRRPRRRPARRDAALAQVWVPRSRRTSLPPRQRLPGGLPRLQLVQLLSAGAERFAGRLPEGVLCNARGAHTPSTAEWAVDGDPRRAARASVLRPRAGRRAVVVRDAPHSSVPGCSSWAPATSAGRSGRCSPASTSS